MATRQFDELNTISKAEKKKRFEEYFGEMELPEDEIEERISLAEKLEAVFKKLFVMLIASLAAQDKTSIDKQFYYDNALFQYQEALAGAGYPDLADQLSGYIGRTTMSIVDTTINYADTPFYVSDERSVFLAMDETNAVLNYDKEMKAREAGYTHKTWVTKNDNRVRDTHVLMNGKTTEIYNTFHVGLYEMRFPLDVMLGAGPEEVVRCRCVCRYSKNNADLYRKSFLNHEPISEELFIELTSQIEQMGGTWSFAEGSILERMISQGAEGVTQFNHVYFNGIPSLSTVLEEAYHVRQFMEGRPELDGVELELSGYLKEIEAKEYLLTLTEKYGISNDEVEETKRSLEDYRRLAEERKQWLEEQ